MLDWSIPGLISFSNSPDCIIMLFLDCSFHLFTKMMKNVIIKIDLIKSLTRPFGSMSSSQSKLETSVGLVTSGM